MSRLVGALTAGVLAVSGLAVAAAPPSQAAASDVITFNGRGWGHGRGMGQFGALGYALQGWTAEQILTHFYGGTTLATNAGNPEMTVELMAHTGRSEVRVQAPAIFVNGAAKGNVTVRVVRSGAGVDVFTGASCTATQWTRVGTGVAGTLSITPASGASAVADMLKVCDPAFSNQAGTVYRGRIDVRPRPGGTGLVAVSALPTQLYLQGVVPREMPASWADQGGGRGAQALRAQAVAARSYALSGGPRASGAQTCDSTACQVYGGMGTANAAGTRTVTEDVRSNTAIAETNGGVMRTSAGAIARTEFSSSTGGFTAGGTFPAVVDAGDSVASNPNHTWTTTMTAGDVAARLGVGEISSISVTGRNGHGADGGRVTQLTVVAGGATRTFTGAQVRSALGLRSDWFTIAWNPTTEPTPAPGTPAMRYRAHVQNIGWQSWVNQGTVAGTSGRALRVEALQFDVPGHAGAVQCQAHVQNVGWTSWSSSSATCGTTGRGLRVEGLRLRLTGTLAAQFDVWYRVHVQNIGWMGWTRNAATAGTEGLGLRVEAVESILVPRGGAAPGPTARPSFALPQARYRAHVQNIGWQNWVTQGATAGTSGRSLRVEALQVENPSTPWSGGIQCQAHVQNVGWTSWVGGGATCGTSGRSLRVEGIRLRTTGDLGAVVDVWYRAHVQNIGWMPWTRNGGLAGTTGRSLRVEAIQVVLTPRGAPAPH